MHNDAKFPNLFGYLSINILCSRIKNQLPIYLLKHQLKLPHLIAFNQTIHVFTKLLLLCFVPIYVQYAYIYYIYA